MINRKNRKKYKTYLRDELEAASIYNIVAKSYAEPEKASIFIKLAEGDENKVKEVEKIIKQNFNLSPRGIREMLKLNNPIYEITSSYGHFGRKPSNKGHFTWEKTDKTDLFKL